MARQIVKIFGVQRSGTNYLEWLLRVNYGVSVPGDDAAGWKHGFHQVAEKFGRELDVVVIAKHPLLWLPSAFRWFSLHTKDGFWKDFTFWLRRSSGIQYWNARHHHWWDIQLTDHQKAVVRYYDLLTDPEQECAKIAGVLGLRRNSGKFRQPSGRVGTNAQDRAGFFAPAYYLGKEFLGYFNGADRKFANEHIDWELAARYGFGREDW